MKILLKYHWWAFNQNWLTLNGLRMRFAELYFKLKPDTAWCDLVMWSLGYDEWESVGECRACDYCGRATYGALPSGTLRDLIPYTPEGYHP